MDIRFCHVFECDKLQDFIRREWSAEHIFVHCKALLDYQHLDAGQARYNFVVAVDRAGQFQAVLGFIPPQQFAADDKTVWLALWKTAAACKEKSIGLLLLRFLENSFLSCTISTVGISAQARLIYRALRFDVLALSHYYLRVANASQIAVGLLPAPMPQAQPQWTLADGALTHAQAQAGAGYRPRSRAYFQKKYEHHPVYSYHCVHSEPLDLTIVYRMVEIPEGKVMRIVDCAGNVCNIAKLTAALMARAQSAGADYIDMLAWLADEQPVLQAGFRKVSTEIVPNYFEPFLQQNVTIECAVKGRAMTEMIVMKGDGDQDRPSRIKGINA